MSTESLTADQFGISCGRSKFAALTLWRFGRLCKRPYVIDPFVVTSVCATYSAIATNRSELDRRSPGYSSVWGDLVSDLTRRLSRDLSSIALLRQGEGSDGQVGNTETISGCAMIPKSRHSLVRRIGAWFSNDYSPEHPLYLMLGSLENIPNPHVQVAATFLAGRDDLSSLANALQSRGISGLSEEDFILCEFLIFPDFSKAYFDDQAGLSIVHRPACNGLVDAELKKAARALGLECQFSQG